MAPLQRGVTVFAFYAACTFLHIPVTFQPYLVKALTVPKSLRSSGPRSTPVFRWPLDNGIPTTPIFSCRKDEEWKPRRKQTAPLLTRLHNEAIIDFWCCLVLFYIALKDLVRGGRPNKLLIGMMKLLFYTEKTLCLVEVARSLF